jgi:hypothetical protein
MLMGTDPTAVLQPWFLGQGQVASGGGLVGRVEMTGGHLDVPGQHCVEELV